MTPSISTPCLQNTNQSVTLASHLQQPQCIRLTGTVPDESTSATTLGLDHNWLSGSIPDAAALWTGLRLLEVVDRVLGEGVKSARGEIAIPGRGDHTRNMFRTSLHTTDCNQTIALETAETMQSFFDHCELLRPMNYCTNYCDSKQLLQ